MKKRSNNLLSQLEKYLTDFDATITSIENNYIILENGYNSILLKKYKSKIRMAMLCDQKKPSEVIELYKSLYLKEEYTGDLILMMQQAS